MKERLLFLDYGKSILILLVVLGHYTYAMEIPFSDICVWHIMHIITLFHMPFFFIVSGILFKLSNMRNILSKGIQQLVKPYLIMCVLTMMIVVLISAFQNELTIKKAIKMIIGIGSGFDMKGAYTLPCAALWFCYVLFFIKILKIFSKELMKNRYMWWIEILLLLLGVLMMFIGNRLWFRIDSLLVGYLFFSIGFHFKEVWLKIKLMNNKTLCIGIFLSLVVLAVSAFFNLDLTNRQGLSINACYFGPYPPLFLLSGISGSCLILMLSRLFKNENKFILTLSNGTIIVLGFHWLVYIYLFKFLFDTDNSIVATLISVLNLLVCYLLILLSDRYFPALLGNRKLK